MTQTYNKSKVKIDVRNIEIISLNLDGHSIRTSISLRRKIHFQISQRLGETDSPVLQLEYSETIEDRKTIGGR